jgi:hypothetical protein
VKRAPFAATVMDGVGLLCAGSASGMHCADLGLVGMLWRMRSKCCLVATTDFWPLGMWLVILVTRGDGGMGIFVWGDCGELACTSLRSRE